MSSENRRLILFVLLTLGWMLGIQYFLDVEGPDRRKPPEAAKNKKAEPPAAVAEREKSKEQAKEKQAAGAAEPAAAKDEAKPPVPRQQVALAEPNELVIGSAVDHTPRGYRLEVQLDQRGAGVLAVLSSRYEAEFDDQRPAPGQKPRPRHRPLKLLDDEFNRRAPPSLAITLPVLGKPGETPAGAPGADAAAQGKEQGSELDRAARAAGINSRGEIPLDGAVWEVVRDEQGRAKRPIPAGARTEAEETGLAIVFRTTVGQPELVVTKTYRLMKAADSFEVELRFESPLEERALVYKLLGPHGIPIEGEWYTSTFRDVFVGQIGTKDIVARSASDIAKKPESFQALPLKFAGIENQYFAVFVQPNPLPGTPEERWDSETVAMAVPPVPAETQKANVTVEITSKPILVGPNVPVVHTYRVFAGPKTAEALTPYSATELAAYHKNQWFGIPGAQWMATTVITPMLDHVMHPFTARIARALGGTRGNYGVAIILLTLTVRLMMFPIGRKQAMAAKKMQDLQPYLKEIQEKFKDDKEQLTRETWALYKKHKVNPLGGCLPALIQLPIFVGLWQALNNSVHLRHASFLWIENLAAPDMLFRMPVTLPLLGDYFNVLPFLVVALMLVQTKLFSPPATTPEMEQQQKMMKIMMIVMAFMFYKVPSGLGIYFITSSLWQIGERLLLPKVTHSAPLAAGGSDASGPGGGGGKKGGPSSGNGSPAKPPGRFAQFWEKLLAEAAKNPTYRNLTAGEQEPDREKDRDTDRDRDHDRGKPRARPGRRR
jgi:YidC/Oxa1 family membrane protein insertase